MEDRKGPLGELIDGLTRQRDELALKIHLGAADARDEFEKARKKLDEVTRDYEPLKDAVKESAGDVLASLELVSQEVLHSFKRIRDSLD